MWTKACGVGGEAPNLKTILNFILFEKDKRVDNGKKAEVIHTHIYIHIYMFIYIYIMWSLNRFSSICWDKSGGKWHFEYIEERERERELIHVRWWK